MGSRTLILVSGALGLIGAVVGLVVLVHELGVKHRSGTIEAAGLGIVLVGLAVLVLTIALERRWRA